MSKYDFSELLTELNKHPDLTEQQVKLLKYRHNPKNINQPIDTKLYQEVKAYADNVYKKPSAYKSGFIVKTYKARGGRYSGDAERPLARWFKEEWKDIGNRAYPVYRPTKRVTKDTPLLPSEIDPNNLKKQIQRKQIIKGDYNLDPFVAK